jgi:hypothetical protein
MTISTTATLFYFSCIDELSDYESFKVQPINDGHQENLSANAEPVFWSVVGKLKVNKVNENSLSEFPVADFPTKMYADIFLSMCTKLNTIN